jgi:hypothetical protein
MTQQSTKPGQQLVCATCGTKIVVLKVSRTEFTCCGQAMRAADSSVRGPATLGPL